MKSTLYLRLKPPHIRGWLPTDAAPSFGTTTANKKHHKSLFWYLVTLGILGVLIYVPIIPAHALVAVNPPSHHLSNLPHRDNSVGVTIEGRSTNMCGMENCIAGSSNINPIVVSHSGIENAPFLSLPISVFVLNSVMMQLLSTGVQYHKNSGVVQYCVATNCGNDAFGPLLSIELLFAMVVMNTGLFLRYLSTKRKVWAASLHIGLGGLVILCSLVFLMEGMVGLKAPLLGLEIIDVGAVVLLTGCAALWWWFRTDQNNYHQYNGNSQELQLHSL